MGFNIASLFSTGATELVKAVGGVVDNVITTKSEKEQLNIDLQKVIIEHQKKIAEETQTQVDALLKDTQDARGSNTQIQLSDKASWLSKNTLYIGFFLVTAGFFSLLIYMLKFEVPAGNKDVLNILLGSLGTAWITIISFFYGSSAGSQNKDLTIKNLTK